jgi:putative resolvase
MSSLSSPALLRVGVVAKRLGLHPMTVRRWLKIGKIKAVQIGREARIPLAEVERLMREPPTGVIVLYGRVSRRAQQPRLEMQLSALRAWAEKERPGREIVSLTDISSGLNAERQGLQKLIRLAQDRRVVEVAVTAPDRLTRFGFEYLHALFLTCSVCLTVLPAEPDPLPDPELTADLLAVVTAFADRLYGHQSRKQQELVRRARQALKD